MEEAAVTMSDLFPPRSWLPNAVTATNITAGFLSMLAAADGRIETAVYLLAAAILLDALDGRMARLLNATSRLGQQLDSFSDAISFGAAPAFLIYQAILHRIDALGLAVSLVYLLAGVFRLARFNLLSDAHGKARRTVGLPIPAAASYLMAAALMRDHVSAPWALALVLLMAVAMTSRWALPDLKGKNVVSVLMLVGIVNYLAVVFRPGWHTIVWWNLWNLLILVAARREDRRLTLQTTT